MSDIEELSKKIDEIIQLFNEVKDISFNGEIYVLPKGVEERLTKLDIPFEVFGNSIKLKLKKYFEPAILKYGTNINSEIKSEDVNNNLLLLGGNGTIIEYNAQTKKYQSYGNKNEKLSRDFSNIIEYFLLFNFLKSEMFCEYFNDANNEIIFYSNTKGIIKIKYDTIPNLDFQYKIERQVQQLIETVTPIQINFFFKNSLFNFSNGIGIISISNIISNANDIVSVTKRDFELVSKQFDFEKFKNSLYKEKEKYFNNIREIINKIFSQAVGIPISISASVFATYKIEDDSFILILVLLAFILYVAFYIKIQLVYLNDICEIRKDFQNDFEIIKVQSGLPLNIINVEKEKIRKKISSSISTTQWLIFTVIVLCILVCWYILYEICKSETVEIFKTILKHLHFS